MRDNGKLADEQPLHVLEIAGNSLIGGMEKYVYNLASHLPAHQIKVTVLAPFESIFTQSIRELGSEVYIIPMEVDPTWRSIQFTVELIRRLGIGLVHAHLPRAHVLAGIAGRLAGVPAVATVHGMDIPVFELGIARTAGTHITVVCQIAYSQAISLGLPPEQVTLIPNGVDLKTFRPDRSGNSFREKMGIPQAAPLIGFVGRLAWEKGPDLFVHMAGRVHSTDPEAHFVLVGEGPMQSELQQMIKGQSLESCVHMAGLQTNTWEVYPALDVLAQTSKVEGMPFALLEAMACGVPVAALSVGGVPEIVKVGITGVTSSPGDWAGLGDDVLKLLANRPLLKSLGEAARRRTIEQFDLRNSIVNMARTFRKLTNPPEGRLPMEWPLPGPERELAPVSQEIYNKRSSR